uniref:NIPA like domain containing 4 n=1 Tax=Sparus aurata TaxID=8175 RepID=A0A671VY64_SPAAU
GDIFSLLPAHCCWVCFLTSLCQRRGSFVCLWGLADKVIARCVCVCFSAVLSSHLLGEVLNVVGKLGCFLCVLGSILLVIHAPQEQEVTSLRDMTNKLLEPGFLVYMSFVLVLCAVLVLYFSPRFGPSNILVYISICSLLGAFTVSSVKGLAIFQILRDRSVFLPLTGELPQQVSGHLQHPAGLPHLYYVLFTSVVLSTSIILFQEWRSMKPVDVVTTLGAFLVIVVGVAMLHLFKELQFLSQTKKQL